MSNATLAAVACGNNPLSNSDNSREPYRTITLTLLRIYPILFMLVGTMGNLLSVYVVLRSKLRRHSTFIYLAVLSIVDLAVLYTFCVNFVLHAWFNIDLQQVSLFACKIYSFSIYFFPQASAWILTAVSLDRVFALTRGVRKPRKTRLTYSILVSIFVILFLLNVQFLCYDNTYTSSLQQQQQAPSQIDDLYSPSAFDNNNSQEDIISLASSSSGVYRIVDTDMDINIVQCSSENSFKYQHFYRHVWVYVDATVNVYLPFTLMFLCSTIIFLSVLRTMGDAQNSNKRIVARNLSTMLLSINAMFALLTAPIVFYLMFEQRTFASKPNQCNIKLKAKYKMIKLLCIILMNANHTGNILVYCLTGTEFRTQLLHVTGLWWRRNSSQSKGNYVPQRTGTINDGRRLSAAYLNKDSGHNQSQISRTSSRKHPQRNTPPVPQRKRLRRTGDGVDDDHNHHHGQTTCPTRDETKYILLTNKLSNSQNQQQQPQPSPADSI